MSERTWASEGRSAFPVSLHESREEPVEYGMTLRDYFAAVALQGILASGSVNINTRKGAAEEAYAFADAMLKARRP